MDAALSFGPRDPLDAMSASLIAEQPVDLGPFDVHDDLLETAELRAALVQHLDLQALLFAEPCVHFVEIACEEGGLVAALIDRHRAYDLVRTRSAFVGGDGLDPDAAITF